MKIRDTVGHYSQKKELLRFETDLEKEFHKLISKIRYGEEIVVQTDVTNNDQKRAVIKAINKSALYNNIEITKRWSRDKSSITIKVEE